MNEATTTKAEVRLAYAKAQNELEALQTQFAKLKEQLNAKQKTCNDLKRQLREAEKAPKVETN